MTFLTNNPIANLHGLDFLVFYAIAITATLILSQHFGRGRDDDRRPPIISATPDPYEIAYLRGGAFEVARLAMFDLLQRGLLQRTAKKPNPLSQTDLAAQQTGGLRPPLASVLSFFSTPKQPHELFASSNMQAVNAFCAPLEEMERSNQLLSDGAMQARCRKALGISVLIIIGIAAYKIWVATMQGRHNIGFLIILGIVGSLIAIPVNKCPRLNNRGREYLKSLQTAFGRLRQQGRQVQATTSVNQSDPAMMLVAVFGFGALAGTPQAAYARMFSRSAPGAGCGSGGGCGSGCSSGGGGCGGGGCGGGGCGGA
jgi:uncharacterized protein (TIGR04222 family)